MRHGITLAALFALFASPSLLAAVPATMSIQGQMLSAAGGPVADGAYTVTFKLYPAQDSQVATWSEAGVKLDVKGGLFQYAMGTTKKLDGSVFEASKSGWLGLQVGNDPELSRNPVHAAPYAMRAMVAEGLDCSACVTVGQLDPGVLAGYAKASDLAGFAKTGDLSAYAKAADLSAYAKLAQLANVANSGKYSDLQGAPVVPKAGTNCGTGLVMKGILADGGLDCVAVVQASKCDAGKMVTEVKADGSIVCSAPVVAGGACQPGQVVTAVKADGTVTCAKPPAVVANCPPGQAIVGLSDAGVTCGALPDSACTINSPVRGVAMITCGGKTVAIGAVVPRVTSVSRSGYDGKVAFTDTAGNAFNFGGTRLFGSVNVVQAVSSGSSRCGLIKDGSIACYNGNNGGDPDCGQSVPPAGNYTQIVLGDNFGCALTVGSGAVACWGKYATSWNHSCSSGMAAMPGSGIKATTIVAGAHHVCALDQAGVASCWGAGQADSGSASGSWDRGQAKPIGGPYAQLAASRSFTCGLGTTGNVQCWGRFYNPDSTYTLVPSLAAGTYLQVATDPDNEVGYCGLRADKTIACVGKMIAPSGLFKSVSVGNAGGTSWPGSYIVCGVVSDGSAISCATSNNQGPVKTATTQAPDLGPFETTHGLFAVLKSGHAVRFVWTAASGGVADALLVTDPLLGGSYD